MTRRAQDLAVRLMVVTLSLLTAVGNGYADGVVVPQGSPYRLGADGAPRYGVWTHHTNGNYVWSLALRDGQVWSATRGGVLRWTPGTGEWIRYTAADGLPDNDINSIEFDAAGRPWVGCGTWNGGVAVMDDGVWTKFKASDGLIDDFVFTVTVDQAVLKWI